MDNDILTDDDFIGANLFGEVMSSLPDLTRGSAQRGSDTFFLADIIRECKTAPVTKSVCLYNEGHPVIGHDGVQSEVTLNFKLLNGGRREYTMKIRNEEHPQNPQNSHRLTFVAQESSESGEDLMPEYPSFFIGGDSNFINDTEGFNVFFQGEPTPFLDTQRKPVAAQQSLQPDPSFQSSVVGIPQRHPYNNDPDSGDLNEVACDQIPIYSER